MPVKKNNYFIIVLLILLFIGPMLGAYFLYSENTTTWSGSTINKGFLITPPLALKDVSLQNSDGSRFNPKNLAGHWAMIYITPTPCDSICETNLYKMRQVRLALGKDMDRVQRVIITYPLQKNTNLSQRIAQQYGGTIYITASQLIFQQFFKKHTPEIIASKPSSLYLVDPLGNVMMAYPADTAPKSLLSDLTRLLNTSQIG